jgi:hypothetical protein
MKKHPLQSDIPDYLLKGQRYRHIGTTTAIAFDILASTYRNPRKWIKIRDHHDSPEADRMLFNMISDIIDKLSFSHFERRVDSTGCYIRLGHD